MERGQQFDQLVEDFAQTVKTIFTRGEDGVWQIPVQGGDILVCLVYRPATEQVIAFSRVATLIPGSCDAERARALLEANAFWRGSAGFTLCMDPETRELLVLDRRAPDYFASVESLAYYVNSLATQVDELRAELESLEDAAEIEAELADEEAQP